MEEYRVVCARLKDNELVTAECLQLTGGIPDSNGVADCTRLGRAGESAYISLGARCLAEASDLTELALRVRALELRPTSFRVDFLRLDLENLVSKTLAVTAISDAILSAPDLTTPNVRFLMVAQKEKIWFGQVLLENLRGYEKHDSKPYRTSNSLPSRLSRALVCLVLGDARSILDPFCGTGSILLEAQALGLTVFGVDHNPKMTGMTRFNLAHFGYEGTVIRGEAGECEITADAIISDLPYGRLLVEDENHLRKVLKHLTRLAPVGVYLTERNMVNWMEDAGYRDVQVYRVKKRAGLSRMIHVGYT